MTQELKVLFIEDREDDMMLVLRALSKGGYRVKHLRVQNETDERHELSTKTWDMVIADFSMPGFSGAEALKIFNEYKLDIPFILVSGSVGEDVAVQMMKDGANDYIMKDKLGRIVPAVERELAECELRRKKKIIEDELHRASLIIESTDVVLWQWIPDPGWPVVYVSPNVHQFGYTPEDFTEQRYVYADLLHPEDKEDIFANSVDNMYHHRDLYKQNYRIVCKGGEVRWLDDYTTIVRNEDGSVKLIQGITYDVTDNTLLGRDLDRSRNLYRSLVDTSPDGICMIDMNMNTVFVNRRKAELLGYDNEKELLDKHAFTTVAPEYHQFLLEHQQELISFGKLTIPEIEFLRKDGSRFSGELRMVLIKDEEGNPTNVINLITDITERKQMQANLIESENRFRISFENAPIGMDMIGLDNKIMKANRALCDLVGYTEEELQNMTFFEFTHPDDLEANTNAVDSLRVGRKDTVSLEKRYIRKDKEVIWVNVNSTLIKNSKGQPLYFLAQVQDITKSKEAEKEIINARLKAEDSDRLKSALLANMSHELRTPLNGIMGFSDLIRKSNVNEDICGMAELINRSGKRLMATLDSIMLLAQLESNQKLQEITYLLHNVSHDLESTCKSYKEEIAAKKIEFRVNIQPGIHLKCEAKLLRQAVVKILENAIKFTEKGFIEISARIVDDQSVEIKIQDTGIGFSADLKKEVLAEFRQVSEGYGRAYEGSGLGLTITQKIIALFGGSLDAESEPGKGSVFTITLPYVPQEAINITTQVPTHGTRTPAPVHCPGEKPLLLIVEDNPINQRLAASFLKNNYEVDCVPTGEEALEAVTKKHYTVILMDINLGSGMDGIETTQKIRALDEYFHTPIIAVTGYTLIGDRERIIAGGCTHYLGKPFSKDQLLETISVAMQGGM